VSGEWRIVGGGWKVEGGWRMVRETAREKD